MSHIHNVAGQSNAAAEYQAYLEALKAARQARENDRAQGNGAVRTFDSEIDTELDGSEDGAAEESDVATEEETSPSEPLTEAADAEAGEDQVEGLGKHYA